jgi:DNA transformation protein
MAMRPGNDSPGQFTAQDPKQALIAMPKWQHQGRRTVERKLLSMAVSPGFKDFIEDLFAPFGPVSIRTMFSGAGLYADGVMFAIAARDTIYLKADEDFARDFAAEGKAPFAARRKNRAPIALSYWEVPERLLDDPDELAVWARRSLAIARTKPKAKAKKPAR